MKTNPYKNMKLDDDEKELEDNFEKLTELSAREEAEEIKMLTKAAKKHVKKIKDKRISIRIYDNDLIKIKELAEEEGLPYQTYITSILHKLILGKLKVA